MNYIFNNEQYTIIDTLEYITLADSFVKNKIGRGHGEAKLYVGNENDRLLSFFENFTNNNCIFRKKDFESFLKDAKNEFMDPQQEYVKKDEMPQIFQALLSTVTDLSEDILPFSIYRVNVEPPRVYVNSNSKHYNLMREMGLPNISYLSVLKLKSQSDNLLYYFKMFIDYKSDLLTYVMKGESEQEEQIAKDQKLSQKVKKTLIHARIGQGEYRRKLLEECPFCPFTMVGDERLLIASHIKPWAVSDNKEKVDPKNGFIFTPTYDQLFDKGFITFEDDKTLVVSPWISPMNQKRLGIYSGKVIDKLPLDAERKKYLSYHRESIFKY